MSTKQNSDSLEPKAVITGMAAATCLGVGVEPLAQRLKQGFHCEPRAMASAAKTDRAMRFPEITHDISDLVRNTRIDNLLTRRLLEAVDCNLGGQIRRWSAELKSQTGVVLGNNSGNFKSYFDFFDAAIKEGYEQVNPTHFPATLSNYSAVQLNSAYSLKGSSTTICSGFSSGLEAVAYAALRIWLDRDQIVLAGGIEEVNEFNTGFLKLHRALSPSGRILPFREERDGSIPGEGIGILMLESASSAQTGGRKILAEIMGYGSSKGKATEGKELLGLKAADAVYQALKMAALEVEEIDAVFSSANGTISGDGLEASVLRLVFGSLLSATPVYPVKSIVGECFSASGSLQCIAAVCAMNHSENTWKSDLHNSITNANEILLPDKIGKCNTALVYSFGLDRTYSAVVLGRNNSSTMAYRS